MKNLYIGGGRVMHIKRESHPDGHVVFAYREVFFSKAFGRLKSRFARKEKDKREKAAAFNYMKQEAQKTWSPAYLGYFDEWFANCTDYQVECMNVWASGKMGPFLTKKQAKRKKKN